MSKSNYVRDNRFFSKNSSTRSSWKITAKIFIGLIVCALLGGALYAGVYLTSKNSISNTCSEFIQACDKKDYSKAIKIYRDTQEKTLTKSIFLWHQEERKQSLTTMEEKVKKMIAIPFDALVEKQTLFSDDDLRLINGFEELSIRELSNLTTNYLQEFLLGQYGKESVLPALEEIKTVNALSDVVDQYKYDISKMGTFFETMPLIRTEYEKKNYLLAATKSKEEIEKQNGFIKEYLNTFYMNCKNEMYPILKNDIDIMMSGSKFYSAKSLIDQLIVFFPQDSYLTEQLVICNGKITKKLVEYFKPVEHLAIRPLIATPSLAFDNDSYSKNAEDLMITTDEFKKILLQLYQNNYMLIDINTLVNSSGQKNRLFYPEGKKPLILTIEGLNYYAGRSKSGNSENLVLDGNGNVASTYRNAKGEEITDRNGEAIGILEQFIAEHPDFSFDGSKGDISLTGFECIFGYVTNEDQVDDRTKAYADNGLQPFSITPQEIEKNKETVKAIITKLKNNGWTFSSSTYGNILVADATLDQLRNDTEKWFAQVGALTGNVNVFLFPSGSIVSSKDEKGAYLISKGFIIQAGIGPWAYFNFSGKNLYMDRISLNGLALRFQNLSRFFDVKTVYDSSRKNRLNK